MLPKAVDVRKGRAPRGRRGSCRGRASRRRSKRVPRDTSQPGWGHPNGPDRPDEDEGKAASGDAHRLTEARCRLWLVLVRTLSRKPTDGPHWAAHDDNRVVAHPKCPRPKRIERTGGGAGPLHHRTGTEDVLPIHRGWGSYPRPGMRLFYSAGDPTSESHAWCTKHCSRRPKRRSGCLDSP